MYRKRLVVRTVWLMVAVFTITICDTFFQDESPGDAVRLNWTDPPDTDLASLEFTWSPTSAASQPVTVNAGVGTDTVTGLNVISADDLGVAASDTAGNVSVAVNADTVTPT